MGGPESEDHLRRAEDHEPRVGRGVRFVYAGATCVSLVGVVALVGACTWVPPVPTPRSVDQPSSTTTDPLAAVEAVVVEAWRSAQEAFFRAESDPQGANSAELASTFADPALSVVRQNLALQELQGDIGAGPWDLGSPLVVSLGPTEADPTEATVVSCIHDTQLLVDRSTGVPVPGVLGTPDWARATSGMVRTGGSWKVASQAFVVEQDRGAACGGA